MKIPRFTAENSLYRSRRQYRTGTGGATWTGAGTISPQQGDGSCCGVHCPGLCICKHGVGECLSVVGNSRMRMAGESVSMAIDACHADHAVNGSQAVAFCSCGCWATSHDAGCFPCHQ